MTETRGEPSEQYTVAYESHYVDQNLREALDRYVALIDMHPNSVEADYSRTQIQNIAKAVVPEDEILCSLVQLVRKRFESMNS